MSKARIVLWRHGQTDWNVANRFQGHSDIPLNAVGRFQADHAAKVLLGMNPVKIISSDMQRTQETAAPLLALTRLTLQCDARLRETFYGTWETKTGDEIREFDAAGFTDWTSGKDVKPGTNGESRSDVANRAVPFILEEVAKTDGLIIFVTHGGTARSVVGKLLDLPFEHWRALGGLSNAQWSVLELSEAGRWYVAEHNAGSIPEPVFGSEATD